MFRQVGVLGSNLIVTGEISFQADYSDKFILISDLAIDGKIIRPDPPYGYDELGSLINLALGHVVLFAMAGAILYFLSRHKIIPNRQSTWFKI